MNTEQAIHLVRQLTSRLPPEAREATHVRILEQMLMAQAQVMAEMTRDLQMLEQQVLSIHPACYN